MSKKHHGGPGPVPPGNRPHSGPQHTETGESPHPNAGENAGAGFQEQDVKRRLGDYAGAGGHPIPQPGRLNDGDTRSR
jgi:hypothetical protein